MPKRVLTKTPDDTPLKALKGLDLKTAATTTSGFIRVTGGHAVKIVMKGTAVGTPGVGAMSVDILAYYTDKTGEHLLDSVIDITGAVALTDTGIGATAGALEEVLVFGGGVSTSYRGGGTLSGDAELLQICDLFKIAITVDTISDAATSHTLDTYVQVLE